MCAPLKVLCAKSLFLGPFVGFDSEPTNGFFFAWWDQSEILRVEAQTSCWVSWSPSIEMQSVAPDCFSCVDEPDDIDDPSI